MNVKYTVAFSKQYFSVTTTVWCRLFSFCHNSALNLLPLPLPHQLIPICGWDFDVMSHKHTMKHWASGTVFYPKNIVVKGYEGCLLSFLLTLFTLDLLVLSKPVSWVSQCSIRLLILIPVVGKQFCKCHPCPSFCLLTYLGETISFQFLGGAIMCTVIILLFIALSMKNQLEYK